MTGEQRRSGDELMHGQPDEMPAQRLGAITEFFSRHLLGELAPDFVDALVTHSADW